MSALASLAKVRIFNSVSASDEDNYFPLRLDITTG